MADLWNLLILYNCNFIPIEQLPILPFPSTLVTIILLSTAIFLTILDASDKRIPVVFVLLGLGLIYFTQHNVSLVHLCWEKFWFGKTEFLPLGKEKAVTVWFGVKVPFQNSELNCVGSSECGVKDLLKRKP